MSVNWRPSMADLFLSYSYLVLLWPFLAFLIIGLWLGRYNRRAAGLLSVLFSGLSMVCGIGITYGYYRRVLARPHLFPDKTLLVNQFDWLNISPDLTVRMGIYLDPISVMMIVVITVIGFLVQIYSLGYMEGDEGFGRFFALLSFFAFSMLGLVVATNIFQMYVFWELVGVSSYVLISFWYHKPAAVTAGKKAFIITRFADAFFLLGIIMVGYFIGNFDFQDLNAPETAAILNKMFMVKGIGVNLLALSCLLIFAGGWGKSAMFPLHIWLPDAMEGPTPVSAIIHSATMVVAGVFLTARMFPLFAASALTLTIVQLVGAFTTLFAAVIALTQHDIKRILAYSTLSQLGYMMFSLGASQVVDNPTTAGINPLGYSASMFHIFTHAFYKCLLFLGAGAIIHTIHTNDIGRMGGLRKAMPKTYWSMLAACLAISGIFPFAGFWSKDEILLGAWQSGHYLTFGVGLLSSGITALYMFRLFFMVFHGQTTFGRQLKTEDPLMSFSIVILAIPTVVAGYFSKEIFSAYFSSPMVWAADKQLLPGHPLWLPVCANLLAVTGIIIAWYLYGRGDLSHVRLLTRRRGIGYQLVVNKLYIDELYLFVTHKIIFSYIAAPIKWFDRHIVDGAVNMVGRFLHICGTGIRLAQNGQLTVYLGATAIGIILLYVLGRLPI